MQIFIIIIFIIYSLYISILNLFNMFQKNKFEKMYIEEYKRAEKHKTLNEKNMSMWMSETSELNKLEKTIDEVKVLAFNKNIDTNAEIKDKIKEILLNPENNSNIPESAEQDLFSYMNDSK